MDIDEPGYIKYKENGTIKSRELEKYIGHMLEEEIESFKQNNNI